MALSNSRTEVNFSDSHRKQVEKAKELYQEARKAKRKITVRGQPAESFLDALRKGEFVIEAEGQGDTSVMALHIFDETGDRRIMWHPNEPKQVKEAAELFKQYLAKGWKAYAVHRTDPHLKGVRVLSFDTDLEEVIFDDRTTADKLKDFGKSFTEAARSKTESLKRFVEQFDEIKLLPKTYPG